MNQTILAKINIFVKKRLIELLGIFLVFIGIFVLISIVSYSPSDPNFIYTPEGVEIKNLGGFYGSVLSDFLLQSFGLISFLILVSILSWGVNLIINKKIKNLLRKFFYSILYINLGCLFIYLTYNNSFWLIDNGNSGFLGEKSFHIINRFYPSLENDLNKILILLLALTFFVLSSGINIKKILKKIFLKKNDKEIINEVNDIDTNQTPNKTEEVKQQSFIFKNTTDKKVKSFFHTSPNFSLKL